MAQDYSSPAASSSALQVIVYWAIVAVPLGWGVYKTVDKSKALFQAPTVTAAASPAPVLPATTTTTTPAQPVVSGPLPVPTPEASPFSTAAPSATVGPIDTPVAPKP